MLVALVLVAALVLIAGRKLTLVPHGKFAHIFEFGYNFISEGVGADVIGEGFKKHIPFLATLFFFILIANVIGLIPGAKAATGTISITWALAAISFIYFNFYGLEGAWLLPLHQERSCPSGVPGPIAPDHLVPGVLLHGHPRSDAGRSSLWQHAGRPYGSRRILSGNHHLPADRYLPAWIIVAGLPAIAWFFLLFFMYALETPGCVSCRHTYSPSCLLPTSAWQSILTDRKKRFSDLRP